MHDPPPSPLFEIRCSAIQGATAAGLTVARVEIEPDGKIVIVSGSEAKSPAAVDARTGVIAQRLRERDGS